jgi:hypothetical protein
MAAAEPSKRRHPHGGENLPTSPRSPAAIIEGGHRPGTTFALNQGVLAGLTLASTVSVAIRTAMAFDAPQTHRWFLTAPIYVFAGLWIDTISSRSAKSTTGQHHAGGITDYVCAGGFALMTVLFLMPDFFNMAFGIYSIFLSAPVLNDHVMPYPTRVKYMASGLLANMATIALLLYLRWALEAQYYIVVRRTLLVLSGLVLLQAQALISNKPFSLQLMIPRHGSKRNEDQTQLDDPGGSEYVDTTLSSHVVWKDHVLRWTQRLSTVFRSNNFFVWLVVELILEALKVLWSSFAERELFLLHKMVAALLIYLPMYFYGYQRVYQGLFAGIAAVCSFYELRHEVISPKWLVAALLCGFQWAGYQLVVADLVSEYKAESFRHGRSQNNPGFGATILGTVAALRPFINTLGDIVASKHLMDVTFLLSCIQCLVWYHYDVSAPRHHKTRDRSSWSFLMNGDQPASHTV